MVFDSRTLDQMLNRIQFESIELDDMIIPCFRPTHFELKVVGEKTYLNAIDNNYACRIVNIFGLEYNSGFGPCVTSISLAIENSLIRGNKSDLTLPIFLTVMKGSLGHVARIRDSGEGFDFERMIRSLNRGDMSYAQGHGHGLRSMSENKYMRFSFEEPGSALNILYLNN